MKPIVFEHRPRICGQLSAAMLARFLLLLLACAGTGARAEWVRLANLPQAVVYIDLAVTRKTEGYVVAWVLRNYTGQRVGPGGDYRSSKDQFEIDCPGYSLRRVYSSDHPRAMGEGAAVRFEYGPMTWSRAAHDTLAARIIDVACARP